MVDDRPWQQVTDDWLAASIIAYRKALESMYAEAHRRLNETGKASMPAGEWTIARVMQQEREPEPDNWISVRRRT